MRRHHVCIVGSGYVGLVTGACLAELGHRVVCVDSDKAKLAALKRGKNPIYEPGLDRLLAKHRKSGNLGFAGSVREGMRFWRGHDAEVVFIAVGTPPRPNGSADLSYVEAVAEEIARSMRTYTLIVDKSTVPVETGEWVRKTVEHANPGKVPFDVASNPEFLSEGSAVADFLRPDRIVLGVSSPRAEELLRSVYAPIKAPVLVTDVKSAELIKHASNSFLATKISFINAVSVLCERTGADVKKVAEGMGLDRRIGNQFLRAGLGFGGFCLHPGEVVPVGWPGGMMSVPISELHRLSEAGELPEALRVMSFRPKGPRLATRPVKAISKRPYDGLLIQVRTEGKRAVRVTADHPMLVENESGWEIRLASDLKVGDVIPCYVHMPATEPVGAHGEEPEDARPSRRARIVGDPVVELERHAFCGDVFSLEVSEFETFVHASGMILHNCFPKDLEAFYWIARKKGYDFKLLQAVQEINEHQKAWPVRQVEEELWNLEGKKVGVLGLSFKPDTDDLRYAPSLEIIAKLQAQKVQVAAYDPVAMPKAKGLLKGVRFAKDAYDAAAGADCLILVTEWPRFRELDFGRIKRVMRHPVVIDGRNFFDPAELRALGFSYRGVGRP